MVVNQKFLHHLRPFFTEGARVAAVMGTGDLIAQTVFEQRNLAKLDWKRTLKFSLVGLVIVGPLLHQWHKIVEHLVPTENKLLERVFKKMALEQFVLAPILNVVTVGAVNLLSAEPKRFKDDYMRILLAAYTVWPLIRLIHLTIMPFHLQPPIAQICGVLWSSYLSLELSHKN